MNQEAHGQALAPRFGELGAGQVYKRPAPKVREGLTLRPAALGPLRAVPLHAAHSRVITAALGSPLAWERTR
jgi:hypothetical protein